MKKLALAAAAAAVLWAAPAVDAAAGEASGGDSVSFNVSSVTSFGINLDDVWQYGLDQELAKFGLVLNLVPYQKLSNRVNADAAVGFIDLTLFHLDLLTTEGLGYNEGAPDNTTTYVPRNRFQTGEFIAGIASGNWIFQMNAGANEPFWSPWNKGLQFVNDGIKFTWAHVDSMVDIVRTRTVAEYFDEKAWDDKTPVGPANPVATQFQQDGPGVGDGWGMTLPGPVVAAMYNKEGSFGASFKAATEFSWDQGEAMSKSNKNGIAGAVDFVATPKSMQGLKLLASVGGSSRYGIDSKPDPAAAGMKASYAIALNDAITLEPYAGTDLGLAFKQGGGTTPLEYEAAGGLTMRWPGQGGWFTDYVLNKDGRVFPGMSAGWRITGSAAGGIEDAEQHARFTLFEPRGDDGVFYGLGSEIILDVYEIAADSRKILATVYADWSFAGFLKGSGTLMPWTTVCYDNLPEADGGRLQALKADAGVKLSNAIANTVFGLAWNSGSLLDEGCAYRLGIFKISVEISY